MRFATILIVVALTASVATAATRLDSTRSLSSSGDVEWESAKEVVVKWTQLPEPSGVGITSEHSVGVGLVSESADDFRSGDGAPIVAAEWWGVDYTGGAVDYFTVRFYADAVGDHPGELLYEEECHAFTQELLEGQFDRYHYYAELPAAFDPDRGSDYWISIQAVHQHYQWFWLECADGESWGAPGVVRSEFFGYPSWVTVHDATGTCRDFGFVIYADVMSPVEATTWGGIKAVFR
jgi:hypothetical protein